MANPQTDHTETMAARLRAARLRAGLSQEKMAAELGLNLSTLRAYERGAREVNATAIFRLLEVFGVDPLWLYTGKGLGLKAVHKGGEAAMWRDAVEWVAKHWSDKNVAVSEPRRVRLYEALVNHLKGGGTLDDDVAIVYIEMAE